MTQPLNLAKNTQLCLQGFSWLANFICQTLLQFHSLVEALCSRVDGGDDPKQVAAGEWPTTRLAFPLTYPVAVCGVTSPSWPIPT